MKKKFLELVDGEWHKNADYWGVAMSLAFDVAGVAYTRDLDNILDFRAGLGGVEEIEDEWRRDTINAMSDADIVALMKFINRVLDALKRAGKDY